LPTYLLVGIFDFNNTTHKQKHTTEHQERHHENIIKTTLAIIALSASALSYAASPQMVSQQKQHRCKKLGWSLPGFTTLMTGGLTGYESR
jgi:hypothetical protein